MSRSRRGRGGASEHRTMEPFAHYRRRIHSTRQAYGVAAPGTGPCPDGDYFFTAEQLLRLVWNAAGAAMAAVGVPEDELMVLGQQLAPSLCQLVSEYGIAIPDSYRH